MNTLLRRLSYFRYLKNLALWPELGRRIKRRFGLISDLDPAVVEQQREKAIQRCQKEACSTQDAINCITQQAVILTPVKEQYPEVFQEAEQRALTSPIRMGGAGNLDLLHRMCELVEANSVLETGVAYGWSSLAVLLSLQHRPAAQLISVDMPYFELGNEQWVGVVVPPHFRSQWTLFRMADREGIPKAIRQAETFDLVHYDSDKSYNGRMWSYQRIWNALRKGGVLISDDIGDNMAFFDFCDQLNLEPCVVEHEEKYQGILLKPYES